jgi:xylulokinase
MPDRGRVSGGGARSEEWLKIVASVLELPLERTAADEGAAFGAALLGGVAGDLWASPSEAAEAVVHPTSTVEPVARWVGRYAEGRETYRALYPAIRDAVRPS